MNSLTYKGYVGVFDLEPVKMPVELVTPHPSRTRARMICQLVGGLVNELLLEKALSESAA